MTYSNENIPTSFDKALVKRLQKEQLVRFYWKVVNALGQYATDEEQETHENNLAYLVSLIGYDPMY
jgi:hypothetical protein